MDAGRTSRVARCCYQRCLNADTQRVVENLPSHPGSGVLRARARVSPPRHTGLTASGLGHPAGSNASYLTVGREVATLTVSYY